jgi:hypothetical protein
MPITSPHIEPQTAAERIKELSALPKAWREVMPYVCCGSFTIKMCSLLVEINKGNIELFTPDVVDRLIQLAAMSSHISCETGAVDVLHCLHKEGALRLDARQFISLNAIVVHREIAEKLSDITSAVPPDVRAEGLRMRASVEYPLRQLKQAVI